MSCMNALVRGQEQNMIQNAPPPWQIEGLCQQRKPRSSERHEHLQDVSFQAIPDPFFRGLVVSFAE